MALEPGQPVTITETAWGDFVVERRMPGRHLGEPPLKRIEIPRDVMLTFLGEFSEKVLALRMEAMRLEALGRADSKAVRVDHTQWCKPERCNPSCPHAQEGVDYCVDTFCRPGCDGSHN